MYQLKIEYQMSLEDRAKVALLQKVNIEKKLNWKQKNDIINSLYPLYAGIAEERKNRYALWYIFAQDNNKSFADESDKVTSTQAKLQILVWLSELSEKLTDKKGANLFYGALTSNIAYQILLSEVYELVINTSKN